MRGIELVRSVAILFGTELALVQHDAENLGRDLGLVLQRATYEVSRRGTPFGNQHETIDLDHDAVSPPPLQLQRCWTRRNLT